MPREDKRTICCAIRTFLAVCCWRSWKQNEVLAPPSLAWADGDGELVPARRSFAHGWIRCSMRLVLCRKGGARRADVLPKPHQEGVVWCGKWSVVTHGNIGHLLSRRNQTPTTAAMRRNLLIYRLSRKVAIGPDPQ